MAGIRAKDLPQSLPPRSALVVSKDAPDAVKNAARALKGVLGDRVQVCDGSDDLGQARSAKAALPSDTGTVLLVGPRFAWIPASAADEMTLASNQSLLFEDGCVIDFTGSDTSDRHCINIGDGTTTPVENARVIGKATIKLNKNSDHGVRLRGDVRRAEIEGLEIVAVNPDTHVDEAASAVSNQGRGVRDVTFRNCRFKGCSNGNSGQGTDFVGGHDIRFINCHWDDCYNDVSVRAPVYNPASVLFYDASAGTYTDQPNLYDNNTGTTAAITFDTGDYLYVRVPVTTPSIILRVSVGNTNNRTLSTVEVSDGNGGWKSVGIVRDNTQSTTKSLAQSGEIEFSPPADDKWGENSVNGVTGYWVRLQWSGLTTQVTLQEVFVANVPYGYFFDEGCTFESARNICLYAQTMRYSKVKATFRNGVNAVSFPVPTGGAVNVRYSYGNELDGCHVQAMSGSGIVNDYAPGLKLRGGSIIDCNIGYQESTAVQNADDCYIGDGLLVDRVKQNCIQLRGSRNILQGAILKNSGRNTGATNNQRAAVLIAAGADSIVKACTIVDDQPSATMTYAVRQSGGGPNRVEDCHTSGATLTPVFSASSGTLNVSRNSGYVTESQGSSTQSGDGVATSFTIAHGLAATPTAWSVTPASADARGSFHVTADSTNLTITYAAAPASGTNNLIWKWRAWV